MTLIILGIFGLGTPELIAIALLVLLLFGGKKIPELMRGLGKGVKSFKNGMDGMEEDLKKPSDKNTSQEKSDKES